MERILNFASFQLLFHAAFSAAFPLLTTSGRDSLTSMTTLPTRTVLPLTSGTEAGGKRDDERERAKESEESDGASSSASEFVHLDEEGLGLESYAFRIDAETLPLLGACCWSYRFVKCSNIACKSRGQDAGQNHNFREAFDVSVARAVAEMRILEYCLPLVRVGGLFVAAKGYDPQEEIKKAEKAIQLMGASTLQLCSVESHGPYGQRTAVVCIKDQPTPRKYPRPPGVPAKAPF